MSAEAVLALAQVALAFVVVGAACLVLRRRMIARRGGVVECCLRASATGRWHHGLAEYRSGQLNWHQSLSLRIRPQAAFDRRDLSVIGSRAATARDAAWLGPTTMIVTCQAGSRAPRPAGTPSETASSPLAGVRQVELAMSQAALTGYLAWLEGAPAGFLSQAS